MNRIQLTALAATLSAGLVAGGAQAATTVKMATIAPGTSAYLTMTTMAKIVNQEQDKVKIQVDATGAATKHMVEVAQGKLDMSMSAPTVFAFMKNGTRMYKKLKSAPKLSENLSLMMWFPYGTYKFVTYEADGMKTMADMKGKKVFLGPPGGGAFAAARGWTKVTTGMEPGKDFKSVKASWSSALQGFQDRQIDVYTIGCIDPCPQLEQLSVTNKLRFLSSDDAAMTSPGMKKFLIRGRSLAKTKGGAYGERANADPVNALQAVVGVTVRRDMDEDTVYTMTKAFWEGVKKARASTPWLADITLEYAVQEGGMTLHPGALKYYKEIGLAVPKGSM